MKERMKGILLMLPLIAVFFLGNIVFTIFALVLGIIGFHELKEAFAKKEIQLPAIIGLIVPAILFLISFATMFVAMTFMMFFFMMMVITMSFIDF